MGSSKEKMLAMMVVCFSSLLFLKFEVVYLISFYFDNKPAVW